MAGNSFGKLFNITTFGESHGPAIGVVVDGVPAGLDIMTDYIQQELDKRKPGQSDIVTPRKESDKVEILSGIFEDKSTGAPIGMIIPNSDARPSDYDHLKNVFRPSHADFTYQAKYGHRDHRGGGRSSARETACRVAAGAIAKLILDKTGISVNGFVSQIGAIKLDDTAELNLDLVYSNDVRCPDPGKAKEMKEFIELIKSRGETAGGIVSCQISGVPTGLGEPVFDKLEADLSKAMMSINAAKGFDLGAGFNSVTMSGSEHNDEFIFDKDQFTTATNHSGGIQGGISNGMDILFRVAFKPVSTIQQAQKAITAEGETIELPPKGRHDPCVVPRAVPVVEAMAAITLADHLLRKRSVII